MADAASTVIRILSTFDSAGIAAAQSGLASLATESETVSGSVSSSLGKVGGALTSVGSSMVSTGKTLSTEVTLPIVAGLGLAANAAIGFQQKMVLLQTQAGYTSQNVSDLTPKVEALASQMGFAPQDLADGLYHIASGGIAASQAMDVLKVAAEGADIGQANLDDTVYSLTSTLKSGIKGAEDASTAMSTLNAIVGAGDMHFQDLNGAISTGFLSTAQTFGVSLQSVGSALAFMTDRGESAQEAATRLRMSISLMGAPTTQAAKLLADIGVSTTDAKAATDAMTQALANAHLTTNQLADDMRKPDGLQVALVDLNTHLQSAGLSADASAALISKAFGGGRSGSTIEAMAQNTGALAQKFTDIGVNSGKFASDFATQQESANQKLQDFKATLDVLMVDIGNKVLPIFEKIAQKLEQWMQALDKLSPKQQQMIVEALLIAAAVGPILLILGSLFQVVGTIITIFSTLIGMIPAIIAIFTSPVTWIILLVAAIALAAYEIYKHWTEIKQGAEDLWHSVAGFFSNLGHDISSAVSNWFSGIKSGLDNFRNQFVQWGKDLVSDIVKIFTDIPNEIKSGISHGISSAGNLLSSLEGSLKGGFDSAFGIPHNAMGGSSFSGGLTHLNEFGPETAILPKGTQIVPADQAKQGGGDVHVHIYGDMMGVSDDTMRTLGDQVAQQLGLRTRQLLNGSF